MKSHVFDYENQTHIILLYDNDNDYMNVELKKHGYHGVICHEDGVYMNITKKTYRTIVDVGANIGIFGHYMINHCKAVKPNKVISFEPYKKSYDILCKNVPEGINYQYAVGGDESKEELSLDIPRVNNMGMIRPSDVVRNDTTHAQETIAQKTSFISKQVTLDSFLSQDQKDEIDLIKIDVEGYEIEVLMGAIGIIETQKPDIFLELHGGFDPCVVKEFHDAVSPELLAMGYNSVYGGGLDYDSGVNVVLSCDPRWRASINRIPAISRDMNTVFGSP